MNVSQKYTKLLCATALGLTALIGTARAATVTVTVADDGVSNIGATGTFYWALTNCAPGDTIAFNIPGAGPHYLVPPPGGFPLVYQRHNVTIDGYTQPGSAVNTAPITGTNNAVIKIVLDGRNGNFRDMAYGFYGVFSFTTTVPPIDNTAMYGDGSTTATGREQMGFTPASGFNPADPANTYLPGEVSLLGVYRSTNVTIKGLAFIANNTGYLLSAALDFGGDTAIRDRFDYPNGSCRGLHVAGCWFGIDPANGNLHGAEAAIAMFRHRDRSGLTAAARRPSFLTDPDGEGLPNGENAVIGVKPGASAPRGEFNVFDALTDYAIAAELLRTRISGNQFLSSTAYASTDVGRYHDSQAPSMIIGTDGDGVNDADEGNLFLRPVDFYNTRGKVFVFAGNVFNLARDGSRPGISFGNAVDAMRLDQGTMVRFGSDFDGVSDALEGNKVYDAAFSINVSGNALNNGSWISMRGNTLVNNVYPPVNPSALTFFDKFMDTSISGSAKAVIDPSSTVNLLKGTCPTNKPPFSKIVIDLYISDPEGDAVADPQGKTYLASFEDNGAGDGDPAPGVWSFNISGLGLASGTNITVAATYIKEAKALITALSLAGADVTLSIDGGLNAGNPTYSIQRASAITGPWKEIATSTPATLVTPLNITVPAGGSEAFYRVGSIGVAQQTGNFADKVNLNP